MPKKIEKIKTTSAETRNDSLEKLRSVFPQFVKDGQVDFDAVQTFFEKEGLIAGPEKYGLSWSGKSNAFRAIQIPATGTLVPQEKESKNWNTTENLFIEGDNLEVLKLLQKHYREKIKMIYIDPPYNTGHAFVYKDNFTENISDYYERTGQTKNGIKMTANTEKNGRYHSDWLTMMYPRLFLARNLLKDDGVIFISIDDNEVANLRLIMDEIFGEENHIGILIHQRAKGGGMAKQIVKGHDYIIAYAKNLDGGIALRRTKVVQSDIVVQNGKEYLRNDDVVRKTFGKKDKSLGEDRRCFYEELEKYKGKEKKKEIDKRIEKGELVLEKYKNGMNLIVEYTPLDEASSKLYSIIKVLSEEGKYDLEDLEIKGFDYPKPVLLIKELLQAATLKSKDQNDLILDFFAGSGTTAHAVMDLNAEDGGNRKWICVQLPEETQEDSEARKAGFKNIAEIARERIRRAGDQLQEKVSHNKTIRNFNKDTGAIGKDEEIEIFFDFDDGFKSFELEKSNYRQWNVLTDKDDPETLKEQMKLFAEKPLVDKYDTESVVYEILVKEGFDLNSKASNKNDIWTIEDGEHKMVISFAKKVTQEDVAKLKLSEDDTFVCFDSALDDTVKVNIVRNLNVKVI